MAFSRGEGAIQLAPIAFDATASREIRFFSSQAFAEATS